MRFSLLTALFLFVTVSCVNQPPVHEIVVERSKEFPPAWVTLEPRTLIASNDTYRLLSRRSKILDLPLGLKQGQMIALAEARRKLEELVDQRVADVARDANLTIKTEDLREVVSAAIEPISQEQIAVADMYFEKCQDMEAPPERRFSYQTYVLIEFPMETMGAILTSMEQLLKKTKRKEFRALSEYLAKNRKHP